MKLNDAIVNSLAPPKSAAAKLYSDDSIPHFAVRVTKAGAKSFVLTVGRERQRITIGRYPIVTLARMRARRLGRSSPRESWASCMPPPPLSEP
jgi:hypothetical protein